MPLRRFGSDQLDRRAMVMAARDHMSVDGELRSVVSDRVPVPAIRRWDPFHRDVGDRHPGAGRPNDVVDCGCFGRGRQYWRVIDCHTTVSTSGGMGSAR